MYFLAEKEKDFLLLFMGISIFINIIIVGRGNIFIKIIIGFVQGKVFMNKLNINILEICGWP